MRWFKGFLAALGAIGTLTAMFFVGRSIGKQLPMEDDVFGIDGSYQKKIQTTGYIINFEKFMQCLSDRKWGEAYDLVSDKGRESCFTSIESMKRMFMYPRSFVWIYFMPDILKGDEVSFFVYYTYRDQIGNIDNLTRVRQLHLSESENINEDSLLIDEIANKLDALCDCSQIPQLKDSVKRYLSTVSLSEFMEHEWRQLSYIADALHLKVKDDTHNPFNNDLLLTRKEVAYVSMSNIKGEWKINDFYLTTQYQAMGGRTTQAMK